MDAVLNTAFASDNLGDHIIYNALLNQFDLINPYQTGLLEMSSHDGIGRTSLKALKNVKRCFVTGGNSIPIKRVPWRRNILNVTTTDSLRFYKNIIFIGAGTENYPAHLALTAKPFLNHVLSCDYIHSTRDELSAKYLNKMGFQALNTGCPTTWKLNNHTGSFKKVKNAVCTINAGKAPEKSMGLIKLLTQEFENVFIWPQDTVDEIFVKKYFTNKDNVTTLHKSMAAYDNLLNNRKNNLVSVNLRLHGGIHALSKGIYSKIFYVDNRAKELLTDINYPVESFEGIQSLNFSDYRLKIKEANIKKFLAQF